MSDTRSRTPWHLWAVGVIGLLWNGYGCVDYVLSQLQGDVWYRQAGMTEAGIAYMNAMPTWTTIFWALGVWGAMAGTLLLLAKSKWAVQAYAVSLISLLVSLVYNYGLSNGAEVMGQTGLIMNGIILAGCLFFVWYASMMGKRGVLR